jgi:putative ABC transport system permease protein
MRIPLLHGRPFDERDRLESPPVAIVNRSMAERYWPEESAIGRTIRFLHDKVDREIVGVVGGIRHMQLSRDGGTEVYAPIAQDPPRHFNVMVRTTVAPRTLLPSLRDQIWKVDADQPLDNPRTMSDVVGASEAERRFQGALLIVLGGVALTLALVGVYGVVSWTVTRRTHEIGIRMALGARRREVLAMMIGQGLRIGLAGVAAGSTAAMVFTRPLSDQLYGVSLADPTIYAVVCGLLLAVTGIASYVPGRRAAKVDPMVALRHE